MKAKADRIAGASLANLLEITRGFDPAENVQGTTLAELWVYTLDEIGAGLTGTKCEKVAESGDVYQLLDAYHDADLNVSDVYAVGLVTWGWAAPIDPTTGEPNGAPSESPDRRRVRLIATVDDAGQMFSRIHFADTGENSDDEGEARGPLAQALASVFDRD